jgi:hypothetical protein
MGLYKICGYTFGSKIPLPELAAVDDPCADFVFELLPSTEDLIEPVHWTNHWTSLDDAVWLAFAKIDGGYLLRFPELADFVVSTDARSVRCYPREYVPSETVRHLLLNQVIPLVLSHLGSLVLHAAACATPWGAIAFMGMTGMGKSTLAAGFGLQGFPILTDDCLLVEEQNGSVMSIPSYPGIRLWPESVSALFREEPTLQPLAHYTEKRRLLFGQIHPEAPVPLASIYVLSHSQKTKRAAGVTIEPLRASEALLEIVKHTFQLDNTGRERLRRSFRQCEWLAKSVPFFKLSFPRRHAYLSAVTTALLNHLETLRRTEIVWPSAT